MPNDYRDDINMDEISSAVGQTNTGLQQMRTQLDALASQMGRVTDLLKTQGEYTKDELRELANYRSTVEEIGSAFKSNNAEQAKHLSDFEAGIAGVRKEYESLQKQVSGVGSEIKNLQKEQRSLNDAVANGLNSRTKANRAYKKEVKEILGTEEDHGTQLRKMARERLTQNVKEQTVTREKQRNLKKELDRTEKLHKGQAESYKLLQKRVEVERTRGRGRGPGALDIAADIGLPGVSKIAQIERYRRAGVARAEERGGAGDGAGGAAISGMGRFMGGMKGLAIGSAVAAGAGVAMGGYQTYRMAGRMAPVRRAMGGVFGAEGTLRAQREAESPELAGMGYGPMENYQTQLQLARQVGGRGAVGQLGRVSNLALATGQQRGEIAQQMGQVVGVGAGAPEQAGKQLEDILGEGVKAGMDSARLTDFTQQTLGIQQELLAITGENSATAIAESLGTLLKASGRKDAAAFFKGPEMQAIRSMDQAMKSVARGRGGQMSGTLFRAMEDITSKGERGKAMTFDEKYYQAVKEMEGGLFGGAKEDPEGAIKKIDAILKKYTGEYGGEKPANLAMQQQLGLGLKQAESLRDLMKEIKADKKDGGKVSEKHLKDLKNLTEANKDPMVKIMQHSAAMETALIKSANTTLPAINKINAGILIASKASLAALGTLVKLAGGNEESYDKMIKAIQEEGLRRMVESGHLTEKQFEKQSGVPYNPNKKREEAPIGGGYSGLKNGERYEDPSKYDFVSELLKDKEKLFTEGVATPVAPREKTPVERVRKKTPDVEEFTTPAQVPQEDDDLRKKGWFHSRDDVVKRNMRRPLKEQIGVPPPSPREGVGPGKAPGITPPVGDQVKNQNFQQISEQIVAMNGNNSRLDVVATALTAFTRAVRQSPGRAGGAV